MSRTGTGSPVTELSAEDALRINVLLAGDPEAVRIDESSMILYALSGKGEARVKLNPNCRDEIYLRRVREALSSHVLGSPGGYPVYLKRWTRMGQTKNGLLESLLLLGEPEAVVAVVNSSGITNEIARRAWWALQSPENARCMLRHKPVVGGDMGPILADFLIEFLPFEEEARDQINTVHLVLQSNLLDPETRRRLWEKARHKNSYYVGFLLSNPDELPEGFPAHPAWQEIEERLGVQCVAENPYAAMLCRLLSGTGQGFLKTVSKVLSKPLNQDVVVALLHAVADYFETVRTERQGRHEYPERIWMAVDDMMSGGHAGNTQLAELREALPGQEDKVRAMLFMSLIDEPVVNPILSRTDAIGSLMRRKLQPVTDQIQEQIECLMRRT